jgi:hypothetical protein
MRLPSTGISIGLRSSNFTPIITTWRVMAMRLCDA